MQQVIVTGGAGFIGSNLVDRLIEQGINVTVLDDLSTGKRENINPKAKFIECDLSTVSHTDLTFYINGADTVFHLAAMARVQPSIEEPVPFHNVNVTGTHNLLVASRDMKVKRFVFSSSSSVYGDAAVPTPETHNLNPISPYALHKLIGEQYCKLFSTLYDIDTVSLRYFNVYGNRMNLEGAYRLVIPIFAKQMQDGLPLTINNDGKQRRDFTHVDDVVNANILAATRTEDLKGDVFNIGNGNNFSVYELALMFGGERQYGNKVIEPKETLADNTKAQNVLGWSPEGNLRLWMEQYKKEMGI